MASEGWVPDRLSGLLAYRLEGEVHSFVMWKPLKAFRRTPQPGSVWKIKQSGGVGRMDGGKINSKWTKT